MPAASLPAQIHKTRTRDQVVPMELPSRRATSIAANPRETRPACLRAILPPRELSPADQRPLPLASRLRRLQWGNRLRPRCRGFPRLRTRGTHQPGWLSPRTTVSRRRLCRPSHAVPRLARPMERRPAWVYRGHDSVLAVRARRVRTMARASPLPIGFLGIRFSRMARKNPPERLSGFFTEWCG
jgi:hypothetical protein